MKTDKDFPDIYTDDSTFNPFVKSPSAEYGIFFYQTKESLGMDAELFKRFINNCKAQFRHTKSYTNYKRYLYEIGLDRCQMMSNITSDMAHIEMHHNGISIEDVIIIITNNYLNTIGYVCTFDIVSELKRVHKSNQIPLVMLSRTAHQLADNDDTFVVPADMCFGFWTVFLDEHKFGITPGIAKKIYFFIQESINHSKDIELNKELMGIRESIKEWSEYNDYHGLDTLEYFDNTIDCGNTHINLLESDNKNRQG